MKIQEKLVGRAEEYIGNMPHYDTLEDFLTIILGHYGKSGNISQVLSELNELFQGQREGTVEFRTRVIDICNEEMDSVKEDTRQDEIQKEHS